MKRIDTCLMMMTGSFLIFASGCITGTNTFSSAGVPTTQYCSIGDRAAPVFDIASTADRGASLLPDQVDFKRDQKISLMP